VNIGSANAQSGWIIQILKEMVSAAASGAASGAVQELYNRMSAPRPDARRYTFTDGEWLVAIGKNGDDFSYYGVNLKTRDSLTLRGATVSGNNQRQVFTWNNGDYRYQVAFQPSDPQFIRLQVFDGTGGELLNRLLSQDGIDN